MSSCKCSLVAQASRCSSFLAAAATTAISWRSHRRRTGRPTQDRRARARRRCQVQGAAVVACRRAVDGQEAAPRRCLGRGRLRGAVARHTMPLGMLLRSGAAPLPGWLLSLARTANGVVRCLRSPRRATPPSRSVAASRSRFRLFVQTAHIASTRLPTKAPLQQQDSEGDGNTQLGRFFMPQELHSPHESRRTAL